MGIMDFIIIGLAIIFAIIGLVKGGAKLFFGLFMLLVIMVGSAFISAAICPRVLKSETDGAIEYNKPATILMTPISKAFPSSGSMGELFDTTITKNEDGTLYLGEKTLKDSVTETIPYVGGVVASLVEKTAVPGETLRTTLSYKATEAIYETVLWVLLVVILAIIRNVLRKKIFVYLDKHSGPSKIDRIIGLVLILALLLIILWGVGLLIAHFDDGSNWANKVDTFITKGVVAKPLMENNPLLKIINVTLPVTPSGESA